MLILSTMTAEQNLVSIAHDQCTYKKKKKSYIYWFINYYSTHQEQSCLKVELFDKKLACNAPSPLLKCQSRRGHSSQSWAWWRRPSLAQAC